MAIVPPKKSLLATSVEVAQFAGQATAIVGRYGQNQVMNYYLVSQLSAITLRNTMRISNTPVIIVGSEAGAPIPL